MIYNMMIKYNDIIIVLFLLFDFDVNEYINIDELVCVMANCIVGFCKMTNQIVPHYSKISAFSKMMFLKTDVESDNQLNVKELLEWTFSN